MWLDVVVALLNAIGSNFKEINVGAANWRDMQSLSKYTDEIYTNNYSLADKILDIDSSLKPQLKAIISLSMISETLVDTIFGITDAIGSLMRKKINPVVNPLSEYIHLLQS